MGKWRNSDEPRWPLDNATLIPWIENNVRPDMWVIELTGGEPSIYPGIKELMRWLDGHGYRVLVKTNGSGDLEHLPNTTIVAAYHRLEEPPKNYDVYLIVDKIEREEKESYCKTNGIPYKVIGYEKENPDGATHGFTLCAFVNPAGHQTGCLAVPPHERVVDGVDYNRITYRPLVAQTCCPHCKAAIDAWRFL
jgi:hypothetical protein